MEPKERIRTLRTHAQIIRSYGDDVRAGVLERLADELEADARELELQRVTLEQAVRISGYTRGHLRRLVEEGKLPNIGSDEAPEFLLGDVPRKPGFSIANKQTVATRAPQPPLSRTQVARAVASGA